MTKFNIGWGLTNICNMRCQFCYSKQVRNEVSECKIDDWKKFVDENFEYIDSINYGTGENSILDDFFYFINYVRTKYPNIKQALTSNGYVYEKIKDNKIFYDIFERSIDEIDLSIDYANKEKHGEFRGQPKAFEWAINALNVCTKMGKTCTIVFVGYEDTLVKENIDGLFAIAKKFNCLLRMNIYRPVSKDPKINERFILSYKTLKFALNYINEKYQIVALSDALLGSVFAGKTDIKENTGIGSIRILPDGAICPSTYLVGEQFRNKYNIKQGKLLDHLEFPEFKNAIIPNDCKGCKYINTCKGGVFDRRILWYDTLSQRDPYCPIRMGDTFPTEYFKISKTERVSVHDDYLPTLFFKNKD